MRARLLCEGVPFTSSLPFSASPLGDVGGVRSSKLFPVSLKPAKTDAPCRGAAQASLPSAWPGISPTDQSL